MTGIRAFMTNKMKVDLRACGFSEEQLAELTPQEGDEILAAANIVVPDSHEVRKFIEIIVAQAKAATKHLKEPGLLQVSLLHPLSEAMVPYRYALDNPKLVEQMTKEIVSASEAGHNVYIEARTVRRGLRGKKRGEAEDTVAVFALVVDSDADKNEAWTPNVPVSLSVETSPGNEHSWLFWERALDFKTGQEFGPRLRAATKTDKPTGNITQPYRIAGTVNYPSDKKKQRGRGNVSTRILNFDAKVLWTLEQFEQEFPKSNGGGPIELGGDPQVSIERIAKALAVIPHNDKDPHEADYWKQIGHTPGRTYMIQIGMAVKAASGGSAEGFELFDKWRKGAPDYKADMAKKKWEGFHPTKIGFGTLKFYADKARPGWDDGTGDPAMDAEVARLATLSDVQYDRERKTVAEKFKVRPVTLDKLVSNAQIKLALKKAAPAARNKLAQMNAKNSVVLDGARTRVLRFEEVEHDAGGEHYVYHVPTFLRFEDFRNLYLNHHIMVGKRSVDLGSWWLEHPQRQQYPGIVFKPGGQHIINGKLNLWRGWGVTPRRGDWGFMREHIFEVMAARDDDVDAYIINWLAWAAQHPDEQPEVALVFKGDRGTGRGTLGKAMCKLFGQHARHISSPAHLTGRFNAHLRQISFLFADEAYAPEDKSAEGTLKRVITEPTLTIEPKGRDVMEEPNRVHAMLASNEDWVIPAGAHERRFQMQDVASSHRQDASWFAPIYEQLRNGGYEAMLFDLMERDLGDWHPRQIVRTAALADQQEQSLSAFDAWWFEMLQTGVIPGADRLKPDRVVSNRYEEEVTRSTAMRGNHTRTVRHEGLYDHARRISPKLKGETDAALGRYLSKQSCTMAWVCRRRGWQFPLLAECRKKWLERFPQTAWRDPKVKEWKSEG